METKIGIDGKTYKVSESNMWFNIGTPDKVVEELEKAYVNHSKILYRYGDVVTGRDWMDEYDLCGIVGCSTGSIKIPLIIKTSRSRGGGGILTDCIVRLMVNGREVYRNPNYKVPQFAPEYDSGELVTLPVKVKCKDNDHVASFKTMQQAERYMAFMQCKRMMR